MGALLKLKPNALRIKFGIMGGDYKNYDAHHLSTLKAGTSERSHVRHVFEAANPTTFSAWELFSSARYGSKLYKTFDGNSLARWGILASPDEKGSIVYAQTDSSLSNRSRLYLSVYSNGNPDSYAIRSEYDHVLSMQFTQTPEVIGFTGARFIHPDKEKPDGPIKDVSRIRRTRLVAAKTLLFAHECYDHIQNAEGVQWDESIDRFRHMDEDQAFEEFENVFGDVALN